MLTGPGTEGRAACREQGLGQSREMAMEITLGSMEGTQLLPWVAGAITLLLTVVTVHFLPSLLNYWWWWWVMKPIPGIRPCYPFVGNALLLERNGEGKDNLPASCGVLALCGA